MNGALVCCRTQVHSGMYRPGFPLNCPLPLSHAVYTCAHTHTYTSRHTVLLLGGGGGALQVLTLLHQNLRLAEITVQTGGILIYRS